MCTSCYDPTISLLDSCLREMKTCSNKHLYENDHSSFIHNSSKLEKPKFLSTHEYVNSLLYRHAMEFYSKEKGQIIHTHSFNMDKSEKHYAN